MSLRQVHSYAGDAFHERHAVAAGHVMPDMTLSRRVAAAAVDHRARIIPSSEEDIHESYIRRLTAVRYNGMFYSGSRFSQNRSLGLNSLNRTRGMDRVLNHFDMCGVLTRHPRLFAARSLLDVFRGNSLGIVPDDGTGYVAGHLGTA